MRLPYAHTLLARPNRCVRSSAAFTIIETLVSLFVVALLTTVVLISLRAVRADMTNTTDLMNLGLTAKDFFAYAADHRGRLVNAGLPREAAAAPYFYPNQSSPASCASQYVAHAYYWPVVLFNWSGQAHKHWHGSSGPNWGPGSESWRYEWDDVSDLRRAWMPSAFGYADVLWTSEEVWQDDPELRFASPIEFEPFFRVHSVSDIRFPGQKGMLLFRLGPAGAKRWMSAFGDGHTSEHNVAAFRPAATLPMSAAHEPGWPVHHTKQGVVGNDV